MTSVAVIDSRKERRGPPAWAGRIAVAGLLAGTPVAALLLIRGRTLLAGVVIVAAGVVPLVVLLPRLALCVVLVVEVTNVSALFGSHSGLSAYLVSLGLAVAALVVHLRANHLALPRSPIFLLAAAYVASRAFTILVADHPDIVVSATVDNLKDLVYLVTVTGLIITTRSQLTITKVVVACAAGLAGITLVQEFVLNNSSDFFGLSKVLASDLGTYTARHTGPDIDANYWARTLVVFLPLALSLWAYHGRRRFRWVWLAAATAIGGGIYLTSSRGGLIAMGSVLLCWFGLAGQRYRRLFLLVPVAAVLALTVPGLGSRLATLSKVSTAFNEGGDLSLVGRVEALKTGVAMFTEHPALGIGAQNFTPEAPDYQRRLGFASTRMLGPHNVYLQMAAEGGVLGIGVWLLFFAGVGFYAARAALVARLRSPHGAHSAGGMLALGVFVALVGWGVDSVFLHLEHFRQLLLVMALAASLSYVADEATAGTHADLLAPVA